MARLRVRRNGRRDDAGASGWGTGDFTLIVTAGPPLITGAAAIIGGWLQARYGRKVKFKIGDVEAEARTLEEVENLLAKAQEMQQRNEPKKIHER